MKSFIDSQSPLGEKKISKEKILYQIFFLIYIVNEKNQSFFLHQFWKYGSKFMKEFNIEEKHKNKFLNYTIF